MATPLLFLTLLSLFSFASESFDLKQYPCGEKALAKLKTWGAKNAWNRQANTTLHSSSIRTDTTSFGTWVEIHLADNRPPELLKISTKSTENWTWTVDCKERRFESDAGVQSFTRDQFTDSDLEALMKKAPAGLIYVWSPGMVYSMDTYPTFERVAKKLKLPLTVLMDPYFDPQEARQVAKKFHMPYYGRRVESVELLMRDIGTHFPETLLYKNGRLSKERIVGAMTPEVLESEIKEGLKKDSD